MHKIVLTDQEAPQRVDRFLMKLLNEATKTVVYRLIRKNIVRVNGKRIKENYQLQIGDELALYLSDDSFNELRKEKVAPTPKEANLEIIFEDEEILIVNKPVGVLTHPDAKEYSNTLATRVQHYLAHLKGKTFTPAPIQRLDKNTSGLVLFAKTYGALQHYNELMRERKLGKFYVTIVEGTMKKGGSVRGFLQKDSKKNKVKIFKHEVAYSKVCRTDYTPMESKNGYTLVDIDLKTGRSHQIRVSMASIGHPVVGDTKYGGHKFEEENGQILHAYKLVLPDGREFVHLSEKIQKIWNSL